MIADVLKRIRAAIAARPKYLAVPIDMADLEELLSSVDAKMFVVANAAALDSSDLDELRQKAEAYDRINTPELFDFASAVANEALHQRER